MLNSFFLQSQGGTSPVRKQNNSSSNSFGNKSTSSRIPPEQASFVSIYSVHHSRFPVRLKYGMRTADYEQSIKHRLGCKTRTRHYGLGIKHFFFFEIDYIDY